MEALYLVVSRAIIGLALGTGRTAMGQRIEPSPEHVAAVARPRYVRPTFVMARIVNPIVARLSGTLVLIVPGRRTGRLVRVPLGRPFDLNGVRYLVSGGGETHWVRNLRAAGSGELRLRGEHTPFRAVELEGSERDRIVEAYRTDHGRAVASFFTALPESRDHPVFRVEPMTSPASTG